MKQAILIQSAVGAGLSLVIAARAFRHRSLHLMGAILGFLVMTIHFAAGYRFGALLHVFFFTSSKLTKVGQEEKKKIDEDFKESGQRNWIQVAANSCLATILVIAVAMSTRGQNICLDTQKSADLTVLVDGVIGHYACCNGDTWSSEIGVLSNSKPRLITTFKKVRKGTNGAVSVEGLVAAVAGLVIGLAYCVVGLLTAVPVCAAEVFWKQLLVIPIAAASGFFGSVIDSLLGATLQFSGYRVLRKKVVSKPVPSAIKISGRNVLNNDVNAISVMLTTLPTSAVCFYVF